MAGNYRSRDSGITASVSRAVKGRDRIARGESAQQKSRSEAMKDAKKRADYVTKKKTELATTRHTQKITELREKGRQARTTASHREKHRAKRDIKVAEAKGVKKTTPKKTNVKKGATTRKKVVGNKKW